MQPVEESLHRVPCCEAVRPVVRESSCRPAVAGTLQGEWRERMRRDGSEGIEGKDGWEGGRMNELRIKGGRENERKGGNRV
jgi:hypothetical protein